MNGLGRLQNAVVCVTFTVAAVWASSIAINQWRQASALEQIAVSAATIAAQGKPPILIKLDDGPAQLALKDALEPRPKRKGK